MNKFFMNFISIVLSIFSVSGLAFPATQAKAVTRNLAVYDISPIVVEETEVVYSDLNIDNLSLVQPIGEDKEAAFDISKEDIDLIALVTMAEAGGEGEEGQRLVIDTILNRVDSEHFPDTIQGVIYQKNAFTPVENGKIEKYWVSDEIVELVKEELIFRTNYECVFFRAGKYSKYGVPLFNVNNQYFSKYE